MHHVYTSVPVRACNVYTPVPVRSVLVCKYYIHAQEPLHTKTARFMRAYVHVFMHASMKRQADQPLYYVFVYVLDSSIRADTFEWNYLKRIQTWIRLSGTI